MKYPLKFIGGVKFDKKMITTVTLTGADDSIHPQDLLTLQEDYPFAEFAILFSSKREGTPRYPSGKWVDDLLNRSRTLSLSAHLCGDYAKNLLLGNDDFIQLTLGKFERIQINHNFTNNPVNIDKLIEIVEEWTNIQFIIQHNKSNASVCKELQKYTYSNIHFLYDASGGRGAKISKLDKPVPHHYTGYAGGISPDNIIEICQKVNNISPVNNVWIDMETHIRSDNDKLFDFKKCNEVLAKSECFIGINQIG